MRSTMAASTSLELALLSKRYTRLPDWADIYAIARRMAPMHKIPIEANVISMIKLSFGHKNHMGLCQNQ